MPTLVITPGLLGGSVRVPASKSLLHRGLFCAALAGDLSLCELPPDGEMSEDIRSTLECVGKIAESRNRGIAEFDFDCRESGTTLRLLIPILAALGIPAKITASGRLPRRPFREYIELFPSHGAILSPFTRKSPPGAGCPEGGAGCTRFPIPDSQFSILSGRLAPGQFHIRGDISSQYVSGLMMALPLLGGDSEIVLTTPLESAPYVEMTKDVMRHFGVEGGFRIRGGQRYGSVRRPAEPIQPYAAEPDFSQAAFWQLARFLGNSITIRNLPAKTSQGDAVFESHVNSWFREPSRRTLDVSQTPDLVPALAAAASYTDGETTLANAARLRLKESDRIASTCDMLRRFGVETENGGDYILVRGCRGRVYNSCTIDSHRDHRIVMTAAMLATRASGPVTILGADAVNKSYPRFFKDYVVLGGRIQA